MKRLALIFVCLFGLFFGSRWLNLSPTPTINVATAKGNIIAAHMLAPSAAQMLQRDSALRDPAIESLLTDKRYDLLSMNRLGSELQPLYPTCADDCTHLKFYNYTDGGTINAIWHKVEKTAVDTWTNSTARPQPGAFMVNDVVDIAADDERVQDVLGNLRRAEVAMIPMSTWLADDDCNDDWCVDLTFHDPEGSGRIFHIVVNLQQETVARTFYTRGRKARVAQQGRPTPFDNLSETAPKYTDGCHEELDWSLCWVMTEHDGLNLYDVEFDGKRILDSVKIGQVEAYYAAWPGGYRDEIGSAASVPPKYDTRVSTLDDDKGFQIRQVFTEPFDWPNCVCCYRYEQIMTFFEDGSFEPRFISHGPGCDDLAEYRPFWRFDLPDDAEKVWSLNDGSWDEVGEEADLSLFDTVTAAGQRLATMSGDLYYNWNPIQTDPLGLDEGRIFLVTENENEGERGIDAGPADSYEPVRTFVNGEKLTNLVLWYVVNLQTKKGGPWWCAPDPDPAFSPCDAILRVLPETELTVPMITNAIRPTAIPTGVPVDNDGEAIIPISTRRPTPRPISGAEPEELVLNGGCTACHYFEEGLGEVGKVGPSLENIGNIAAERVPGQTAAEYLTNSILYPNLFLAPECPNGDCMANIMPKTYHLTLADTQLDTIVDYLLTLQVDESETAETEDTATSSDNTDGTLSEPDDDRSTSAASGDDEQDVADEKDIVTKGRDLLESINNNRSLRSLLIAGATIFGGLAIVAWYRKRREAVESPEVDEVDEDEEVNIEDDQDEDNGE